MHASWAALRLPVCLGGDQGDSVADQTVRKCIDVLRRIEQRQLQHVDRAAYQLELNPVQSCVHNNRHRSLRGHLLSNWGVKVHIGFRSANGDDEAVARG